MEDTFNEAPTAQDGGHIAEKQNIYRRRAQIHATKELPREIAKGALLRCVLV